jgi:tRNA 2-thiouridine synthesizing protein D
VKLTIMVQPGPYTFEPADTAYALASAALDRGWEVAIFHYLDAVWNMSGNMKGPKKDRNIGQRYKELADRGVQIRGCGLCAKYRGMAKGEVAEGMRFAGTAVLGEMIDSSERFVNLGF